MPTGHRPLQSTWPQPECRARACGTLPLGDSQCLEPREGWSEPGTTEPPAATPVCTGASCTRSGHTQPSPRTAVGAACAQSQVPAARLFGPVPHLTAPSTMHVPTSHAPGPLPGPLSLEAWDPSDPQGHWASPVPGGLGDPSPGVSAMVKLPSHRVLRTLGTPGHVSLITRVLLWVLFLWLLVAWCHLRS